MFVRMCPWVLRNGLQRALLLLVSSSTGSSTTYTFCVVLDRGEPLACQVSSTWTLPRSLALFFFPTVYGPCRNPLYVWVVFFHCMKCFFCLSTKWSCCYYCQRTAVISLRNYASGATSPRWIRGPVQVPRTAVRVCARLMETKM